MNTEQIKTTRTYTTPFDVEYFSKIDTEERAYWFGVLSNRGHLTNNALYLNLNTRDRDHLQKFLDAINSKHRIYTINYGKTAMITIHSKRLVEMFCDYGFVVGKSFGRSFPPLDKVPTEFQRPFIRGLYDSGSSCNGNGIVFTGTKDVLEHLNYTIYSRCDASLQKVRLGGVSKISYVVGWGGRIQAAKVLSWVYKDSRIHLSRKYNGFVNLKSYVETKYEGEIRNGNLYVNGHIKPKKYPRRHSTETIHY